MTEHSRETAAVYWDMMGKSVFEHDITYKPTCLLGFKAHCKKCDKDTEEYDYECPVPDPIPLSPAELAEYMMRKCDQDAYIEQLCILTSLTISLCMSTPQQRIDAAVKAWKGKP